MYKVSNICDVSCYGKIVVIEKTENEGELLPFFAMQQALKNRRLWLESGATKIRFLVDGKIMSVKEMERWSRVEYQSIPKCPTCAKIFGRDVYTHRLCGSDIFCSQACANQSVHQKSERLKDEEEVDYL